MLNRPMFFAVLACFYPGQPCRRPGLLYAQAPWRGATGHSVEAPLTLLWGLGARGSGQGGVKNVGRVKGQGSLNSVCNGLFGGLLIDLKEEMIESFYSMLLDLSG
jgi:hypothetical protein